MGWKWSLVLGLVCVGCGPSTPSLDDSGSTGEDTTTGSMESTGMPMTMTTAGSSGSTGPSVDDTGTDTGPDETTGDTGSTDESTGDTTSSDTTDGTDTGTTDGTSTDDGGSSSSGDPPDLLPNGAQCSANEDCQSNECWLAGPLGGICGECNEDSDCPAGGCSAANVLTSEPSYCNMGELGEGCETSAACMPGLECGNVLEVPGILDANTCGECLDDTDCPGQTCQPNYSVAELSGQYECVNLGSLPDGAGCDLTTGDAACTSGTCATADFMMLLELGVCSECANDTDCPGGTCQPAEIDLAMGLVPATCI